MGDCSNSASCVPKVELLKYPDVLLRNIIEVLDTSTSEEVLTKMTTFAEKMAGATMHPVDVEVVNI